MLSAVLWCLLSAPLAPLGSVGAVPELPVQADVDEASIFVPPLESLARWCARKRLYGRRDWVYEQILRFDPEHRSARRFLKYNRSGGQWVQSDRYRPGVDRDESALQAYAERLAQVAGELRDRLGQESSAIEEREAREQLWESFLLLFPDDEAAQATLGRVAWTSSSGQQLWIDRASFAAWERRMDLRKACRDALGRDPVATPGAISGDEPLNQQQLGAHVEDCAQLVHAAQLLLSAALPGSNCVPEGMQIVVLCDGTAREEYLGALEWLGEDERPEHGVVSSWWVPNSATLVLWDDSLALHRRDAVTQSVAAILQHSHRVDPLSGWLVEGLACFATEELLGRPSPYHALRRETSSSESARGDPPAGSLSLAELDRVLGELNTQKLRAIWSRKAPQLSRDELALSACLTRFLVEARPDALTRVLRAAARAESGGEPLLEALRREPQELIDNVRSWHRDMALLTHAQQVAQD